jgi:starch phosphorylase
MLSHLLYDDPYLLLVDYDSYVKSQDKAAAAYQNQYWWTRASILNVARCGYFSSDRSMAEYCQDIWGVTALESG